MYIASLSLCIHVLNSIVSTEIVKYNYTFNWGEPEQVPHIGRTGRNPHRLYVLSIIYVEPANYGRRSLWYQGIRHLEQPVSWHK